MAPWKDAHVDDRKILDYLLAPEHPIGVDKATFFRSLGYTRGDWMRLRDALLSVGRGGRLISEQRTSFGIKYVVDGMVQAPDGRNIELRTVWISDGPDDPPRLVTAYPR